LLAFTLLLNSHVVSDGASGDRTHNSVMVREVAGHPTNDSTLQAPSLGGRDTYGSEGHNRHDNEDLLSHLGFLEPWFGVTAALASVYIFRPCRYFAETPGST
jgi:hypothetical protein